MTDLLLSAVVPLLALAALPALAGVQRRARLAGPEWLALAAALALTWCMAGGMLLGALSALESAWVKLWLAAGVGGAACWGIRSGFSARVWLRSWRGWGALLLLAPPLLFVLLLATVPPWYRDSLVYHLALPRYFAEHGGYAWPDDNVFAALPIGWESALSLLYAWNGAPHVPAFNPRLAGAWMLGAAALAAVSLARVVGASRTLSAAAGALLVLLPTAVEFGASAYVESALLLLVGLALWAALRAARAEKPGGAWLASALLAGFACWVKYPALALIAFLAPGASLFETLRAGEPRLAPWAGRAVRWGLVAALVGSPFFVRNWLWRGNPFFPTAFGLFGGEGWDSWRAWAYGVTLANYGHGREPLDYLLLPWRLFTQRGMGTGFEGSLGPLVALGLPFGLWLALRSSPEGRAARLLTAWVVWISVFWALSVQQVRFYLIATPALLALLAAGVTRLTPQLRIPRPAAAAAAVLVAAQVAWSWGPTTALWSHQLTGEWLAGRIDRPTLLSRMLPESYRATRELESLVPEDGRVWLVWMRGYSYYLRRDYRLDCVFEAWRLEALLDEVASPRALGDALRSEGITHLLVNHRYFLSEASADLSPGRTERLRARFSGALASEVLAPVRRWGSVALYAVADAGDVTGGSPSPRAARSSPDPPTLHRDDRLRGAG